MDPKAGGGGGFIVPFGIKALVEEVVGKFTVLGSSIDTQEDIKLHPTIMCIGGEVVFGYELLWDVLEVNGGILGEIEGCAQVKFLCVKAHKVCAFAEEYTID